MASSICASGAERLAFYWTNAICTTKIDQHWTEYLFASTIFAPQKDLPAERLDASSAVRRMVSEMGWNCHSYAPAEIGVLADSYTRTDAESRRRDVIRQFNEPVKRVRCVVSFQYSSAVPPNHFRDVHKGRRTRPSRLNSGRDG